MDGFCLSIFTFDFPCKHPVSCAFFSKVFPLYPSSTFPRVSPSRPPPQLFVNCVIHIAEGLATGTETMVIGPSTYYRVELHDKLSSGAILQFFDDSSNLFQK